MKRLLVIGLVVALGAGCVFPGRARHPHGMPPGQAKHMVHAHGHACGHAYVDGVWIVVR